MKTLILSTILGILVPLFAGFALFLFFRGHNSPGGGFIAGLVVCIPFIIHALAFGQEATRRRFRIKPFFLAGLGLFLALLSGLFGMAAGKNFLAPLWLPDKLPLIGKFGTPILFDLGVFLLVAGIVLQITFLFLDENQ